MFMFEAIHGHLPAVITQLFPRFMSNTCGMLN